MSRTPILRRPSGCSFALIPMLAACGAGTPGGASPAGPESAYGLSLIRSVDAIEVYDEAGQRYDFPFLGGLNIPRPQLVDIDADGDLDLFVQESSGRISFFEQTGSPAEPRYVWRSDSYQDLAVGEWFRFHDMDGDGDVDLLAEQRFSYIRYYRNDGTPQKASFSLATDSLRDDNGVPIFSDRQNIPNVTDIDCDGQLDLFIGRLIGTVVRYEATANDKEGVPRFELVTERFEGIEIVAQIGSRHGANTLALADVDGDGDEDLFWGDFFEPGLLFIENLGTCRNPDLRGEPVSFPEENPVATSGYNASTFGDIDADGDLDLLMGVIGGAFNPNRTTVDNLYLLEQRDAGFVERTKRYLTNIDVGSESIPALADLDADGDLDVLLANKLDPEDQGTSRIYHFENVGDARRPQFRLRGPLEFEGSYHYAPALGDLDADGDLDMIMGTWRDELAFYRNEGTAAEPRFVLEDSALMELTRGSNATPALVDIDADGDLDLFVGEGSGALNFYRNDGSSRAPLFVLVSDEYADIDVGRRSFPSFADLDGDGDQDLLLGRDAGPLFVYRNDGTPTAPAFVADTLFVLEAPSFSAPALVDIDADGDLDLLSGGVGGGLVYYENRSR